MAQLTWRNIDAPNLSTSGLGDANRTITDAFGRLGDVFAQRESKLRKEATDAALARRLAITDLSKLGELDLSQLDGRADKVAVAQGNMNHLTGLLAQASSREILEDAQAKAALGGTLVDYQRAVLNEDPNAEAILDGVRQDPRFNRGMALFGKDMVDTVGEAIDNKQLRENNTTQNGISQQNADSTTRQVDLSAQRLELEKQQARKDAEKVQKEQQYLRMGHETGKNMPVWITPQDMEVGLTRSKKWGTVPLEYQETFLKGAQKGFTEVTATTEDDYKLPGAAQSAGNAWSMPGVVHPGARRSGKSANELAQDADGAIASGNVIKARLTNRAESTNPNFQIERLAGTIKKEPDREELMEMFDRYADTWGDEALLDYAQGKGMNNQEIQAFLKTKDLNSGWVSNWANNSARFRKGVDDYVSARDKDGQNQKAKIELATQLGIVEAKQKRLESLIAQRKAASRTPGGAPARLENEINGLIEELRGMPR